MTAPDVACAIREQTESINRLSDATELQNALLLEVITQFHIDRAQRHPDPDRTTPSHTAVATRVIDRYGDLYGDNAGTWPFEPITQQTAHMGDQG